MVARYCDTQLPAEEGISDEVCCIQQNCRKQLETNSMWNANKFNDGLSTQFRVTKFKHFMNFILAVSYYNLNALYTSRNYKLRSYGAINCFCFFCEGFLIVKEQPKA